MIFIGIISKIKVQMNKSTNITSLISWKKLARSFFLWLVSYFLILCSFTSSCTEDTFYFYFFCYSEKQTKQMIESRWSVRWSRSSRWSQGGWSLKSTEIEIAIHVAIDLYRPYSSLPVIAGWWPEGAQYQPFSVLPQDQKGMK